MAVEVDYIPTLTEITAIRKLGYNGTNKIDAVLRWFRTEKDIFILPQWRNSDYVVNVYIGKGRLVKQIHCTTIFINYSTAAVAGINKAVFYLQHIHKQANITFRQLS